MVKELTILGSTGSIGRQALDVADMHGIRITALTSNSRIDILENQVRQFSPEAVAVADEKKAKELKIKIADTGVKVLSGSGGVTECASMKTQCVLNSIVGIAGLGGTVAALEAGNGLALANKESLVAGGSHVTRIAREKGISILPVDSEHSAVFQSLAGCKDKKQIKKLILTASGGPFFGKTKKELENVTLEQALSHPNWAMGAKITVDSATMMNKGLEIIEAAWLFGIKSDKIDVVVHRQSVLHSAVQFVDNSVIGQLGVADMRIPIQYALTYPDRAESPVRELDLTEYMTLTFEKPDYDAFPCISYCKQAFERGGLAPAFINGANEKANELFRSGKIKFTDIPKAVENALTVCPVKNDCSLSDVYEADSLARQTTEKLFGL
ncbi:MAG: 1-deoxy-D-xylulose-5-phosphate reductoisomerase [Clostridiales bacterium]|nr:1-deoxy-D-xylulose-5-phosphate reductoisomerase [Clostridiales bacterium]